MDEGLGVLEAIGVTFDYVAVLPRHLEHVSTLGERHPNLRIVIDHLGAPPIGVGDAEPWWTLIARAAENPLVFAKLSGLYSRAGALEESNVDLTGELVSMITAQRVYQANAQTIKTEDQILQTIVNLR